MVTTCLVILIIGMYSVYYLKMALFYAQRYKIEMY